MQMRVSAVFVEEMFLIINLSMVAQWLGTCLWLFGARGPRCDPHSRQEKFLCLNTFSLVSFAEMTLDKCFVLRIWTFVCLI